MTEITDIIELAKRRAEELKQNVGLVFGDFDMVIHVKGVVHGGELKSVEIQFPTRNCSRKIIL